MMYRGIIHAHSTYSYDGKLPLPALKELLTSEGLSFACMTEHTDYLTAEAAAAFIAECRALSDASFVFIPGFEVPYRDAHVLHVGATAFRTQFAKSADELLAWRSVASLVVLAHPVRNHFMVDETLLSCIDGVEIWNQQYEGKAAPRTRSVSLLQELRQQKSLLATGGTDLHRAEHLGTPMTQIDLPELSEAAILAALKDGMYTFGNNGCSIDARAEFTPTISIRFKSGVAISIITMGKLVNAVLARVGIRLPKRLVRFIRGRV